MCLRLCVSESQAAARGAASSLPRAAPLYRIAESVHVVHF